MGVGISASSLWEARLLAKAMEQGAPGPINRYYRNEFRYDAQFTTSIIAISDVIEN